MSTDARPLRVGDEILDRYSERQTHLVSPTQVPRSVPPRRRPGLQVRELGLLGRSDRNRRQGRAGQDSGKSARLGQGGVRSPFLCSARHVLGPPFSPSL